MTSQQKFFLLLARVVLGWFMFYAGITKVLNPNWSAAFYLKDAKMFHDFYQWLLQPALLPVVNFINAWGLTLLGASLIFGALVRLSAPLGALLMLLYYFPILAFPYPDAHSYIVDDHIVFAAVMLYFAVVRAGRAYGLDAFLSRVPFLNKLG